MKAYIPENPFGIPEERPLDEQFRGHLIATAASAVTAAACAIFSQKTGTEFVGYPLAALSESIALFNAKRGGDMAYFLGLGTVSRFLKP